MRLKPQRAPTVNFRRAPAPVDKGLVTEQSGQHGQGDNAGGGIDGFAPPLPPFLQAASLRLRASPKRQPTEFSDSSARSVRITITQYSAAHTSGDHRTSFAPETIATRRRKRDRRRQVFRKINASHPCPAAHNGLVGGSNPPGPTRQSKVCGNFLKARE